MKKLFFLSVAILLFASLSAGAQIINPVKWSFAAKKTTPGKAVIFLKASIEPGWHVYSQTVKEGGPVKTSFNFSNSADYTLIGATAEPAPIVKNEPAFNMSVGYFEKEVIFQQVIKLKKKTVLVKGKLNFMTCNDHQCLPPEEVNFKIPIK